MAPNEVHTKVIQELFDSKVLGTSQNPAKEIQKLKDLVNLQYEYDTGNAPSASQRQTTKQQPKSRSNAPSTSPLASTSGKHSSREVVQDLFADRARKLAAQKKEKEAAEIAERKAKALAKKEATSLQQAAAISKQAKYAREEKERMAEEKTAKERVLKNIEADKVERKEREERRKEAARIQADEMSQGPVSKRPKQAHTTRTMSQPVSSRPNPTFSGRTHPSDIRFAGSQVPPRGRSLASRNSTAGISHGEHFDGKSADEEYPDDEGYSDEEHLDQGYPGQGYTLRNNNNQKPSQRHPPPHSVTREDNPAERGYASRPSRCAGVRLGGPQGSSYTPLTPSLTHRPRQRPRATLAPPSRAGLSTRSSRPSPQPRRNNVIEGFDTHECAMQRPKRWREMTGECVHPRGIPIYCSHCYTGMSTVCMPCVVKGCKGKWCDDCWDAMVERKQAVGSRKTRPPGWQECPYARRSKRDQGGFGAFTGVGA